jgi:tetratricopeptide (TPR) repeat protein
MGTKSRLIAFLSLFFTCLPIFSNVIYYKEEVNQSLTSSLSVVQKNDSIFKKRFLDVKQDYEKNDLSKSLEKSLILLDDLKKVKRFELEYLCTFLIGDLFRKLNNHERAIEYYKKSLNLFQEKYKFKDIDFKGYDSKYNKLNYILSRNFLRIGNEFNRLKKSDSAIYFYTKATSLNSLNNDLSPIKASAYTNLSGIYIRDSIYDLAVSYSLKAIEIRKKTNDKLNEAAALGNLASIYLLEKDYKKAKKVYKNALKLIEFDESKTALSYKQSLYFNLAWTLYLLKDYTAYNYQEKSYIIKDSLKDANFEHVIKGSFEKHQENLQKEKTNLIRNKLALEKAQERKTNWFLGAVVLLILISSGVIVYNYKLRQNNLKLKLDQTQLAQKSKLEKLKS